MRVDVWSDVACPWCWLGKRHLEEAIRSEGVEGEVEIAFRSFELDPARGPSQPAQAYLARKLGGAERVAAAHARLSAAGAAVGLRYDFERQLVANTFAAHRVHHRAKARGVGGAVMDRFMRAYHGEGADLSDPATIRRLAVEAGLAVGDVDEVLSSDAHAEDVRRDEREARSVGISGVPFFVFDGKFGVSGAQPVEVLGKALRIALGRESFPEIEG